MYKLKHQYVFKQLDTVDSAAMQVSQRLFYQYWIILISIYSIKFSLVAMTDKFTRKYSCL